MNTNKVNGFTLIEMMIAVAIIGVLAAIAFPSYQQYRIRENRTEVESTMVQIAQKLAAYKLANNNYGVAATTMSTLYGTAVYPQTGTALYDLALDTTTVAGSWTLSATPKIGTMQVGNGVVLLNDQGWRCWTKATTCTLGSTSNWDAR